MYKINKIFGLNDDDINKVRKYYNKSEDDIKCDVAILKEWIRQQPHLPDDEDDCWLERMLLCNKCRIEVTKERLENLYTYKTMYAEITEFYTFENGKFKEGIKHFILTPLPKMTDKLERIVYYKPLVLPNTNIDHYYATAIFCEIFRSFDSSLTIIYIVDWTDVTFEYLRMFDLPVLKKYANVVLDALNLKFSHTIYYKTPSYIDFLLRILKMVLKPKLVERISIHETIESMEKILPKELLPIEYGGQNGSVEKLYRETCDIILSDPKFVAEMATKRSNESLRVGPVKVNELFGADGSFKKLNLD